MLDLLDSIEVQDFLGDFSQRLEISFDLEESKKQELIEVAKNKGILLDNSKDLGIFRGTYEVLDVPNGNGKILESTQEVIRKLPRLIGRPINIGHVRRMVVGFMCDFKYIEKEKRIDIFGIFFKSCFQEEWDKLVKLFKEKKVGLSSEIWAKKSERKYNSNGSFSLGDNVDFAGVAIIYMNGKDKPAEPDCLILETSKKNFEVNQELIFSSLNKEIISGYSCDHCSSNGNCGINCENLIVSSLEQPISTQPSKLKVICSHCSHNFEYLFVPNQTSSIKCPQCRSILNQQGEMLYPPQDLNFSLSCPNDSANNWLIVSSDDNSAKVRCQSCGKEYDLTFKQMPEDMKVMLSKIQFLHSGSAPCWQCGHYNNYNSLSNQEKVNLHCSKCGLDYVAKPYMKLKRDILKVEESGIKKDEPKDKGEKNLSPSLELIMAELDSRNNK